MANLEAIKEELRPLLDSGRVEQAVKSLRRLVRDLELTDEEHGQVRRWMAGYVEAESEDERLIAETGGRRLTREEVERRIRLLRMPVDFDGLIERGVLARRGSWYEVLDPGGMPEHLWVQIGGPIEIEGGRLRFRWPGRPEV